MNRIASLAGRFELSRWAQRPTGQPHHSASAVALVGGGSPPRPGEISLAHHGVLFLDELPEFPRAALEALREPLETGTITIARAARRAEFPARFQLIAAMNPCPCGYLGSRLRACRCSPEQVSRYQSRLSGPLLDRIDLRDARQFQQWRWRRDDGAEPRSDFNSKPDRVSFYRTRGMGARSGILPPVGKPQTHAFHVALEIRDLFVGTPCLVAFGLCQR